AEDGIRSGHVTGVQTCALPISAARAGRLAGSRLLASRPPEGAGPSLFDRARARTIAGAAARRANRGAREHPLQRGGDDERPRLQIGRASCRERVWSMGVAVALG